MTSNQARTVMGALESSLETLRIMKGKMVDSSSPHHPMQWAIGSLITTLVANLLKICNTVIGNSLEVNRDNAREDLLRIKAEFSEFMDRMIGDE